MPNQRTFEDDDSYYGENIYNHKRGQVNILQDKSYIKHRPGQESLTPRNYQYTNGISSKNRLNDYSEFYEPARKKTNIVHSRYTGDGQKRTFYDTPSRNYLSHDFYKNEYDRKKPHSNAFQEKVYNKYKKRRYETPEYNIEKKMPPIDYRLQDHRYRQRRFSDSTYDRQNGRDMRNNIYIDNYAQNLPEPTFQYIQSTDYRYPNHQNYPDKKKVHYTFSSNNNKSFYKDNDSVAVAKIRSKSKLCIIIFNNIFLLGGLATGLASCIKAPWWSKTAGNGDQLLSIGLWETCKQTLPDKSWECHKYSTVSYESPFKSIKLLQSCMIASVVSSGAAILVMCVVGFSITKHPKITRLLIYIAGILTLGAAILYGLTVAYAVDNKNPANLVPIWVEAVSGSLEHAVMFYVSCAAAACLFLALIHIVVLLFINDDYDTDQQETQSTEEDAIKYKFDNPEFDGNYNYNVNQDNREIKQQFELHELQKSPKLVTNLKQKQQSLAEPVELSGVSSKYLVHNGKTHQHPFNDRQYPFNDRYTDVNEGYNHSINDVNEGYIQEQNLKIVGVKKKHSLPNILNENYNAENYPRQFINSVPTPAVYMYKNTETDFKNNVSYKKNIVTQQSLDYETYFNNPY
ncbi:uncharacterized protein LOC105847579 isoform X1 [Hydra vulgaris]|uniref:uncharacterized protein LOC105847579 isoform X1 n=1 Tax=Hydra vulgaris TaxID=6087 RepID=UPI001F5E59CF|nr:uncharacterized protein LOC105847579 [Hydra vulgaris]